MRNVLLPSKCRRGGMSSVSGKSRWERMNRPPHGEPWVWFTRSMMESPAWRAIPGPARQVVDRIMIEHMLHGGTENGNLIVTYDDFEAYGIRRGSTSQAIRQAEALGFVDVIDRGRRSFGSARRPARYGLTWLPRADRTPASNRWKSIQTDQQAKQVLLRLKDEAQKPALPISTDHVGPEAEARTPAGNI